MKQGFLVPVYRHAVTAGKLTEKLAVFGLPIILIDDGNGQEDKALLEEIAVKTPGIILVRLEKNSGKGSAMLKGFQKAEQLGITHVLQIDADGQHEIERVSFFLEESAKHPDKIICGFPEYDKTAPKSRVIGRKISNFWAAVTTLSGELKDVLCGFRVYPVLPSLKIISNPLVNKRMGIDAEMLVRLYWKKVYPVFYPVKITYPKDGFSNFRMFRDNVHISWTFTRLCVGMLIRFPLLFVLSIQRRNKKI